MRTEAADWGMRIEPEGATARWVHRSLLFIPGIVVAALVAVFLDVVVGALVAVVVIGVPALLFVTSGRRALRALGARPLGSGESPRLGVLVAGISGDLGLSPPSIWILSEEDSNALVCHAGGPAIAITTGALKDLTLTELEAVVTHCLVRAAATDLKWTSAVAVLGFVDGLAPTVGRASDVRTVALTRYPPALVSALTKSTTTRSRFGPLWFAGSSAAHTPSEERIALLQDL